jgi:hypothetical protein
VEGGEVASEGGEVGGVGRCHFSGLMVLVFKEIAKEWKLGGVVGVVALQGDHEFRQSKCDST